jgi:hypothetical protein
MTPSARRLLLAFVVLAATFAVAGPASAAVTIGSNLKHMPNAGVGDSSVALEMLPATSQATGGVVAPSAGVVVRWRFRNHSPGSPVVATPRIFSGNVGGAAGSPITAPAVNAVFTYPTRLPIKAGDVFGYDATGIIPAYYEPGAGTTARWTALLGPGEARAPAAFYPDLEPLINADIEPDADQDGYGDETQDQCSMDASAHGPCPPPPAPTQPSPADTGTPTTCTSASATDQAQTGTTATQLPTVPTVPGKAAAKKCTRKDTRQTKAHKVRKGQTRCGKKAKPRHHKRV